MLKLFERYDYLALPSAQVFPFDADLHWPQAIAGRPWAQLVEAAHRAVPVEETAQERQSGVDGIDMILRFGAHGLCS